MSSAMQFISRRTFSVLATAVAAAGILSMGGNYAAPKAKAVPQCAPIILFAVPGTMGTTPLNTTEMSDNGLMRGVVNGTKARLGDRVVAQYVPYAATAGTMMSYNESQGHGVQKLSSALSAAAQQCPDAKFAISGYSQGAHVAGEVAHAIGHDFGPIPADKLIATGLIADPQHGTAGELRYGTASQSEGILPVRENGWGKATGNVVSVCNQGDIYCDSQPGYRTLANGVLDRRAFTSPVTSSEANGRTSEAGLNSAAILNGMMGASVWHQSYHLTLSGQDHDGVTEVCNFIAQRGN